MSTPSSAPSQNQPLFRTESLESLRIRPEGSVILAPKFSGWVISGFFSLIAICILILLWQGSYTRRVTVSGQLLPADGLIKLHTPQRGVVIKKNITDGQVVAKGDLLFVIDSDRTADGAKPMQAAIAVQVGSRKQSLLSEMQRYRQAQKEELDSLERRIENLQTDASTVATLIAQQEQRLKLAQESQSRYQKLLEQNFISGEEALQKQVEASEQLSRLKTLQRDALSGQRDLIALTQERDNVKQKYQAQIAQLERDISLATQELTEIEGRRQVLVTATEGGRATLVSAEVGQFVDSDKALATLIPEESTLIAKLYAPSRSIGFVQKNDQVLIRYQAFPYQQFGQHEGVVRSVSTSSISPADLASVMGTSVQPGESYFSIDVDLKSLSVKAGSTTRPLQPGMILEADILQENRRLYEWILEPLYGMTERAAP
ncbi:MAG: HlyD family efflux transporter periplasmic adaptor subunit [Burkholderiales bacterium]|jgi:membrane fusion protein|uniref:HlyD family secretion protein n=1 Tax=Limnobacter sp. TaxID=2003368 RepID=UPI0039BD081F|nr:HlyD family efflux transporter periplasmic adaptor subunit [Burkholderiales bacterium]